MPMRASWWAGPPGGKSSAACRSRAVPVLQEGELRGHPEGALPGTQPRRQPQGSGLLVVGVQPVVHLRREAHPVVVGEPGGQGPEDVAGPDADLRRERLGREVGGVEVVLPPVEEVADLLVRGERQLRVTRVPPGGRPRSLGHPLPARPRHRGGRFPAAQGTRGDPRRAALGQPRLRAEDPWLDRDPCLAGEPRRGRARGQGGADGRQRLMP